MGKRKISRQEFVRMHSSFRDNKLQHYLEQKGVIYANPFVTYVASIFGADNFEHILKSRKIFCSSYAEKHGIPTAFIFDNPNASTWYQDFWTNTLEYICQFFSLRFDRNKQPSYFMPDLDTFESFAVISPFKRNHRVAANLPVRFLRAIAEDRGWD